MSDESVERRRLIFPGLAGFYQSLSPYSYAFMRFATGAVLFPHGVQKVFTASISPFAQNIGSHGLPFPGGFCLTPLHSGRPGPCTACQPRCSASHRR